MQTSFGRSYPADTRSGAGVRLDKLGLAFRVQLDYTNIVRSPVAPTSGLLVSQNADGSFVAFDLASLPTSPLFISTLLTGPVPEGYPPRRGQFLRALEARQAGSIATLLSAVPSDAGDPINTAWFHTIGVLPTGRLAQFAKTTLGLSDVELDAAIAASRSITE